MTDGLERICAISDLSAPDRERLRAELQFIAGVLRQIDRGAGFCEDRGFSWTAEQERAEGSLRLFESLRAWPILRRLLPRLRHYRHQQDPVIGAGTVPIDDVEVAMLLVGGISSFSGRYGEGLEERIVEVAFEADSIRVSEQTTATALNGQPFDYGERTVAYAGSRSGALWADLEGKLLEGDARRAAMLAERMNGATIPCDRCGRAVQSFAIAGILLTIRRRAPEREQAAEVGPGALLPLRKALAGQDLPTIRALDPSWVEGYCPERDASFCRDHLAHA